MNHDGYSRIQDTFYDIYSANRTTFLLTIEVTKILGKHFPSLTSEQFSDFIQNNPQYIFYAENKTLLIFSPNKQSICELHRNCQMNAFIFPTFFAGYFGIVSKAYESPKSKKGKKEKDSVQCENAPKSIEVPIVNLSNLPPYDTEFQY